MSNDDDMLEEYDLSAWEAPPPPADLADGVIDRMGGTDVGIAVPVEGGREPRRAWIVAGVAVAVVALGLGVWSLIRATHPAAPSSGGVVADKARTLSLDTVHADLDIGADVRWRRVGNVLEVEQRAGSVTWHVDSGEKVVIDAGASLASVEAEGANLRVEVQMNATDARMLGATAAVAAAAALVTVVVYEGHVKVARDSQTVVVAPGSTYQVKREEQEAPVVGGTVGNRVGMPKVAILGLELVNQPGGDEPIVAQVLSASMREVAKTEGPFQLAPASDKELVDEKLLMNCANEATPCMAAIGVNLDADFVVFGHIEHGKDSYSITLKLLDVAQKQVARSGQWQMPNAEAEAEGLDTWAKRSYLGITTGNVTTCDADALKDEGVNAVSLGQHEAALAKFERSLRCQFNSYVLQLAFMESCASSNAPKAKQFYKQLSPAQQQKFAQMCIRTRTAYIGDDDDQRCDEVSCVLNNYEGDCCQKYKKGPVDNGSLTRAQITAGMAKVKSGVMACAAKAPEGGKLVVKVSVAPSGSVSNVAARTSPNDALSKCATPIIEQAKFPSSKKGSAFSYPFVFAKRFVPPATCDADALKDEGVEAVSLGQHALALSKFDASLRCKFNSYVLQLAFMEACASRNSGKATQFYKQLSPAQQQKFAQQCIRTSTPFLGGNDTDDTALAPRPTCDADALKDEGVEAVSLGQHAAALSKFEASLRCKHNTYVLQLAFMEACASSNSPKAKTFYKQMTPEQQNKFSQMCDRTNTRYDDSSSGNPFGTSSEKGYLQVLSKPEARIYIDGVDSGLKTPITGKKLPLSPGKHKVTFHIGSDQYTYPTTIKAGETETMSKDLQ